MTDPKKETKAKAGKKTKAAAKAKAKAPAEVKAPAAARAPRKAASKAPARAELPEDAKPTKRGKNLVIVESPAKARTITPRRSQPAPKAAASMPPSPAEP